MANEPWNEVAYRFFNNMLAGIAQGITSITGGDGATRASGSNPLPVRTYAAAGWAASQIDVTTGQVTIAPARPTRSSLIITNLGTTPVYIGSGSPSVSSTNGGLLPGVIGATLTIETVAAVVATAGSTQRIAIMDFFG